MSMTEGIVYVLTNPAMPGIVKIGKTTRGMGARLNELYSTGVPLPFECEYAARVDDESKVERAFHQAFGPYRINPRREFFDIDPEQAIALLELMALEDMTPALQEEAGEVDVEASAAADKFKRRRRPSFRFTKLGISEGSTLQSIGGDQTCTVSSRKHVEFEGTKDWSLSALAQHLTGLERPLRGPAYFTFKGRKLSDIYDEVYDTNN